MGCCNSSGQSPIPATKAMRYANNNTFLPTPLDQSTHGVHKAQLAEPSQELQTASPPERIETLESEGVERPADQSPNNAVKRKVTFGTVATREFSRSASF
mmetsp:Transcript_82332/g.191169  ORF Transcript_82332/g.191169 Transcript_82332/m.191169 type:complete len:100 (-) Transcript_82332:184-483(-)